ncbi:MAG TPA: hypothetical protein VFC98_00745 [Clostridia bacterium]|nr:hypothetical protein [Clostridia bacterium]
MNKTEALNKIKFYKMAGLSSEGSKMINLIRGCVLRSFLINEEKKKLCHFMDDLEEYLDGEEE